MSRQDIIALLQALSAAAQVINVGLLTVTRNPLATLISAAFVSALQNWLNGQGNASITPPVKKKLAELDSIHAANAQTVAVTAQTQTAVDLVKQVQPVPPLIGAPGSLAAAKPTTTSTI